MKPRPILLTGFEPFGGHGINPSAEAARALHGRTIDGSKVVGVVLPCVFYGSIDRLQAALDAHRPRLVLALGLAAEREGFTPERVAINLDDARIPDNAGAQPIDRPVLPGGPVAYFSTLPIKAMVEALRSAGHAASISPSAGSYVCNHVFYGLMHLLRRRRGTCGGFMHLCGLPRQQATLGGNAAGLPLETLVDGVAIALATAAAHCSQRWSSSKAANSTPR